MSPVRRIAASTEAMIGLIVLDIGWFIYLTLLPLPTFFTSRIWAGVVQVSPFHDPRLFAYGFALAAVGLCIPVWLARGIGLLVGLVTWGALATSHAWAAIEVNNYLGLGGALLGFFAAAAHAFVMRHLPRRVRPA